MAEPAMSSRSWTRTASHHLRALHLLHEGVDQLDEGIAQDEPQEDERNREQHERPHLDPEIPVIHAEHGGTHGVHGMRDGQIRAYILHELRQQLQGIASSAA